MLSFSRRKLIPVPGDIEHNARYRIMGLVRRGEETDFFTAFDTRLCRMVMLKKLKPEWAGDEARVNAFINEAKLICYLEHPGVIPLYETLLHEGAPCHSMRLADTTDLRGEIPAKSRNQLLSIFTKLCETLAFVHDKGVMHLALRPENIMIGQYGEVLIVDWSTARLFDEKPYREYLKLVRNAPVPPSGTGFDLPIHAYSSPEQVRADNLSPSSDIFSLGVILYEMMTGKLPFPDPDPNTQSQQILCRSVQSLHEVNPEIPRRLSEICARMLDKDPFHRYHTLHAVLHDIDIAHSCGQAFTTRRFAEGEIIFNEGDSGDYAFTIVSGKVQVLKKTDQGLRVLAILGEGEIVGELAVFTNEARTATVRTMTPTVIRIMDRDAVERELGNLAPWVGTMVTAVARRFIGLNEHVVKLGRRG